MKNSLDIEACVLFAAPEPSSLHVCGLKENNASMEVTKSVTPSRASGCLTKKYFLLKKCLHCLYTKVRQNYFPIEELSAQVYTPRWQPRDFLPMFCKCFTAQKKKTREQNRNLPPPLEPELVALYDVFNISQNNFQEWLRVWIMDVSKTNPNNKDLFMFARENKAKFTDLVKQEILKLNSVKVSFGLQVKFSIERNGETQHMKHYFKEEEPHVFNRHDKELIEQKYDEFIERIKGEIENWFVQGSGWEVERIETAHVNVARYQPLRGGTYLPLPANLVKKKAIINITGARIFFRQPFLGLGSAGICFLERTHFSVVESASNIGAHFWRQPIFDNHFWLQKYKV